MHDLHAVYGERRTRLLGTLDELHDDHRAAVESIIDECDRRLAGDTSALSDNREVRARINRVLADVLEATLVAYNMRGHAVPGDAQWMDRKADLLRALTRAKKPTRSARRLVAAAVTYDDRLTVEVLTSPASRVLLHGLTIELRAVQVAAVRALATHAASLPGVAFVLAQESEISLAELVVYAQFLAPIFP